MFRQRALLKGGPVQWSSLDHIGIVGGEHDTLSLVHLRLDLDLKKSGLGVTVTTGIRCDALELAQLRCPLRAGAQAPAACNRSSVRPGGVEVDVHANTA